MTFFTGIGPGGESVFIGGLGGPDYQLFGPVLISPGSNPSAPPNYLTAVIHTGSITLLDLERSSIAGPYFVNLTITLQSATPEPSTLLLFATGMMGIIGVICRRAAKV